MLETKNTETRLFCAIEKGHDVFQTLYSPKISYTQCEYLHFFFWFVFFFLSGGYFTVFEPLSNGSKDSSE